jgi:putative nucleotidyltransferase with HDIG domain
VATAICAELISRHLHMKHDFAFTAGLLHDIGRLVLVSRFPKEYEAVLNYQKQNDCSLLNAEQAILNTNHVIAGFILAMHWQFSDAIQDAIRGHHQPDEPGLNSIASIIHVANSIVHGLDLTQSTNDMVPDVCQSAWDNLALTEADYHAIFKETSLRFESIDQIV